MKANLGKLLLLVLFCLGGSTAFSQQYYISGPTSVGGFSTPVYSLVGVPNNILVVWTAVNGHIVGSTSGVGLTYTYVFWDQDFVSGSLNATFPNGELTNITIYVHRAPFLTELPDMTVASDGSKKDPHEHVLHTGRPVRQE